MQHCSSQQSAEQLCHGFDPSVYGRRRLYTVGIVASGYTKGRQVLTLLLEGMGKGSAVIGCAWLAPKTELVVMACPPSPWPKQTGTISQSSMYSKSRLQHTVPYTLKHIIFDCSYDTGRLHDANLCVALSIWMDCEAIMRLCREHSPCTSTCLLVAEQHFVQSCL